MQTRIGPFVAVLLLTLARCHKARECDFTMVSTSLADPGKIEIARTYQNPGKIDTEVIRHWIFFFPIGSKPTIKDALDQLQKQGNGDVAVDVVLWDKWWWIPMVYGRSGWKIEGRVLNTHSFFPGETAPPPR